MLVALVLLLAFVGRSMQRAVALLGGAGFGLCIDEVGKLVTSSNDYFFQPAVTLIYAVFVAIFLRFRTIERGRRFTSRELVANASMRPSRSCFIRPTRHTGRGRFTCSVPAVLLGHSRGTDSARRSRCARRRRPHW